MIYLDSHLVVWLYQKEFILISRKAIYMLENNELSISPIIMLELEYLYEVGRIKEHAQIIIDYLSLKVGLQTSTDAVLITKDTIIQKNYSKAVWS